jgi:hypothetical protein
LISARNRVEGAFRRGAAVLSFGERCGLPQRVAGFLFSCFEYRRWQAVRRLHYRVLELSVVVTLRVVAAQALRWCLVGRSLG